MDTKTITLSTNISMAAEQLAAAILKAEPIAAYQQARERLEADPEANELLERFSKTQVELRMKQSHNAVTQADMEQLRELQRQVRLNDRIMDYARTQQDAIAYLPTVNIEISQLLGIDFAALAKPSGCC